MQLSPSKLNVLNNCPRCFWLENAANVKRPRGIFSSLPGGIDRILKPYYDSCRPKLPEELEFLRGYELFSDQPTLNKWRHWQSGLTCMIGDVKLIGALDDCLIDASGAYVPLDYKTRGSFPKDDGSQYYQTQLDCYNLMLQENGLRTADKGVLVYYWPTTTENKVFKFGVKHFTIECSAASAVGTINRAVKILSGPMPIAPDSCEYCRYEDEKKSHRRNWSWER